MLKSRALIIAFSIILLLILIVPSESKRVKSTFIGIKVCRKCHESSAIGAQYSIWAATPHARAFQTLSTKDAVKIAQKNGIGNPLNAKKCLKCHATGGGRNPEIVSEGVGCEACHGPGSRYFDFDNHASFNSRDNAYRKAITLGMYPIIGDDSIKARERLCRHCHTNKRPCMQWDKASNNGQKELPLSIIADFIYRHPLR